MTPPRLHPLPLCWVKEPGAKQRTNWFVQRHHEWQALPMEPLRVTAMLDRGFIPSLGDALHLDSILAYAAIQAAPKPVHFDQPTAVVAPLPVRILTTLTTPDGATLPLWATSTLAPTEARSAATYQHKRYPKDRAHLGRMDTTIDTRTGQHKDRRTPHRVILTPLVTAVVIGHAPTIRELLGGIPNVGKRHHAGYGRVLQWLVEPLPFTLEETTSIITASRPTPLRAQAFLPAAGHTETLCWTPPYWFAPWREPCRTP